jgi:hypothetical protein
MAQLVGQKYGAAMGADARFSSEDWATLDLSELEAKVFEKLVRSGLPFGGSGPAQEFSIDRFGGRLKNVKSFPDLVKRIDAYNALRSEEVHHEFGRHYQQSASPTTSWDSLNLELSAPRYASAHLHAEKAQTFLSSNPPDPLNAIKEATCVVESLAKIVNADDRGTLGDAIKELSRSATISGDLKKTLEGFWVYANNLKGSRHAGVRLSPVEMREIRLQFENAAICARRLLSLDLPRIT